MALLLGVVTPAHAAGTGILTVTVTPVDSVTGAVMTSVAYGQHQDHVAYRVSVSCSVADCADAQVAFSPSQPDPYGLAAQLPSSGAAGNSLLEYDTWTAPSGAGTPTGTDATGKVFPLGTLAAGSGLSFTTSFQIVADLPSATIKPAEFYPDGFQIVMSATASSSSAVAPASATAAPVTWHNRLPTPSVTVWPPSGNVAADTSISIPVTMTSGASGASAYGPTWNGTSNTIGASNYTVVMTLPAEAVVGAIPDGGVFDAAAHTITWTRGSAGSPDYAAAGGWGLDAYPGGWYGSGPPSSYNAHVVPLTFPGTAFSPTGCDFSQTVPVSVSTTVTYLDPARTTKTASNSGSITVSCTSPFPGSSADKHSYVALPQGVAAGQNVVVPQPGNPSAGDYFWRVIAYNESNVEGVATIVDNALDQADAPVTAIYTNIAATFDWKLDDGTTGTTSGVGLITAPAGRHYAAVTATSAPIAPGRVTPSDTTKTPFVADYHYQVDATAPVGQTRTNTAAVTMAWPSQASDPAFSPQTTDVDSTITFVASKPSITATFPAPPQVANGSDAAPGRDVTFSVAGKATNIPTGSTFTPEYVFIAPEGWTINANSATFAGTVPPGASYAYATKTIGGAQRQVVVATWPNGTTFSNLDPMPTMTVVAQPTFAVTSGTTSTATAWIGDSARNWDSTQADWTNPVQNGPDVDGTGDTTASFSSATQDVPVSSNDSLSVKKEICLSDTSQPDGCQWIANPGQTVPVNVNSTNIKYRVTIQNTGNTQLNGIVAYDVLPYVGDTGLTPPTSSTPRGSGFDETLGSVSNVDPKLTLTYSASTNPSRPEVSPAGTVDDWGANPAGRQAIRAAVNGALAPGGTVSFVYSAALGANATTDSKACNSVAIVSASTPASEPLPVCAQLTTNPTITLTKTADTSALSSPPNAGDPITYTLTGENSGDVMLTGVTIDDPMAGLSGLAFTWPGTPGSLNPGQAVTATATYHLTQADIDAGHVSNNATATATAPAGNQISSAGSVDTTLARVATIALNKTADPTAVAQAGDTISYQIVATNTGNVSLSSVTVSDPMPGLTVQSTSWPGADGDLAPGESVTVTASYTATQNDVDSGSISNTATVMSAAADGSTPAASSSATVVASPAPKLTIVKSADPVDTAHFTEGQKITYSFVITNAGNVTVSDVGVQETAFTGHGGTPVATCPAAAALLAPSDQVTCTATYTVTADDVAAGEVTNTAAARGTDPTSAVVISAPSKVVLPGPTHPALELVKTADKQTVTGAGQTVTYAFEIRNTGDIAVHDVGVAEGSFTATGKPGSVDCPAAARTLLPGQSVTCTMTYVTAATDHGLTTLRNTAIARATSPSGDPVESAPSTATTIVNWTETGLASTGLDATRIAASGSAAVVALLLGAVGFLLSRRRAGRRS